MKLMSVEEIWVMMIRYQTKRGYSYWDSLRVYQVEMIRGLIMDYNMVSYS